MSSTRIDFAPGGQAVIEGVLMRSPNFVSVAVRNSKGEIILKEKPFTSVSKKIKPLALPIVRGVVGICEMMMIGFGALNFSSQVFLDEPVENAETGSNAIKSLMYVLSLAFAFGISIFLFKFIPLWITTQLQNIFPVIKENYLLFNLIDGIIKISMFIGYLSLMLLSKDMKRVFQYHGAEHKSVFTYEKALPLTPEHARTQSRFHPRCGTSFILLVLIISIITYMFLPKQPSFIANFALRLAWLPVIGGISYEILKWSAKHIENPLVRLFVTPGLLLQRITTQEPDDSQLEVALHALASTLKLEKEKITQK